MITKSKGQSSVTLPEGQNFDLIFPGRSNFLDFLA
jgi:hypothetical protein